MIGEKIKAIRTANGLSTRDFSNIIDNHVTAQAISRYERGEISPSSTVLEKIAKAMNVPKEHFVDEAPTVPVMLDSALEFRKRYRISRKKKLQLKSLTQKHLENYFYIESLLDSERFSWDRPRGVQSSVANELEIEHAAALVRASWNLGIGPISSVSDLMEGRGIKVVPLDMEDIDGFSATATVRAHSLPVIVVNSSAQISAERQRFTMAHELGHIVLSKTREIDKEKAANRFAGAFLMPKDLLRSEVGFRRKSIGWDEFINLKQSFGVSAQALTRRCRDLEIIGETLFRKFLRSFEDLGWSCPPYKEPSLRTSEVPTRYRRLCYRALSYGSITKSQAASLMGMSVTELDEKLDNPPSLR